MPNETIFSKIIRGEIPADILYQDEEFTAFRDTNAQAPTHVLIIPNKVIPTVENIDEKDAAYLGKIFFVAQKIAEIEGISESGYRLIINCKEDGGQEVFHLHMHLMGGEALGPMRSH